MSPVPQQSLFYIGRWVSGYALARETVKNCGGRMNIYSLAFVDTQG